jgi:HAD superfamily hydrolase (TIGR01509 family)
MHTLVIFDCDGVLIDSEMLSCDVLIEELARVGIRIDRDFVFRSCIGKTFETNARNIEQASGVKLAEGFEAAYREALLAAFDKSLGPMPGVVEILDGLGVDHCVATSSSRERAERSLKAAGLSDRVGPLFTASMVGRGKPAPDLFLHVAEQMNAPPAACLIIEDSLPGLEAARAAGMTAVRFTGGSHFSLGFGKGDPMIADREFSRWDQFFALYPDLYRRG